MRISAASTKKCKKLHSALKAYLDFNFTTYVGHVQLQCVYGLMPVQAALPAVDEVRNRVMDAKGCCVQISADLHIVSGHDADRRLVLFIKHLPLEGCTQQQHEVV